MSNKGVPVLVIQLRGHGYHPNEQVCAESEFISFHLFINKNFHNISDLDSIPAVATAFSHGSLHRMGKSSLVEYILW